MDTNDELLFESLLPEGSNKLKLVSTEVGYCHCCDSAACPKVQRSSMEMFLVILIIVLVAKILILVVKDLLR